MNVPRFLLDTTILSEAPRPQPNQFVMRKLEQYSQNIATATVVFHELMFGCYRLPPSRRQQELEEYIASLLAKSIPIFSYDLTAAQWHASERARLVNLGRTPPYIDGQIAAIAAVNDLILITNNTADYADFQNLQLENWFES
ncbi:type II toxin-antitoxin system VapC family toxin (plasmid) [Kovacikia minuta CCNUW1]|uniref:type II toxin-antitoxin system VapC family toxin n=1 Tax=Kovacikia minuta TaxID=2931930 RepID=UPI001CCC48F4|nr:type II toxin-antitoxin system VapC family toxin [Kovacikia minuta]UBF30510.1 type II toxin-antitoxin system VapC family toxin [Kovacikia minuta CCNUW1]